MGEDENQEVTGQQAVVFEVLCQSDMTEGRGAMRHVIAFFCEDMAWEYCNRQTGVMGRRPSSGSWRTERYQDWTVRSLRIHHELPITPKEAREKAMAILNQHLTPNELVALGGSL